MEASEAIDLLFGGMGKLGPGSDADTLRVLELLPRRQFHTVVDAGCGAGRQTLALAKALGMRIHAVDSHQPFLQELDRRAREAGLGSRVEAHCMDMKDIPSAFPSIDLLWSEGAAYSIGFATALATWARAISDGGFLVASELCWLRDEVPDLVREFFATAYPEMKSIPANVAQARAAGYRVLETYILPREAWVEGYYDLLGPRAKVLADHPDPAVRNLAQETLQEIEIFERSENSYGYVFLVLQPDRLSDSSDSERH